MRLDLRLAGQWMLTGMLLLGTVPLAAAEPAAQGESQPVDRRQDRQRGPWMERASRFRALDKHERNHDSVRVAFRDVVSEPHRATVRVMSNDKPAALGTIVSSDGYILTKASELHGALTVKLSDRRLFDAKLVALDRKTDLAMLKIDATDLPVVTFRDISDTPAVGSLLASPGLETLPVSIGVVSVQPRAIAAPSGILGVVLEDADGAPRVHEIMPGSGAEKAGIKPGDKVTTLNGQPVRSRQELVETVRQFQPGDKLALQVERGGEKLDVTATLGARPSTPEMDRKEFQNTLGGRISERRSGFPLALQHDTILAPEDCGGPLVDLDGRCVGINIARAGRVNSYALPASVVVPLLAEFKSGKYAVAPSDDELREQLSNRWEELKVSESSLASKLAELLKTIQSLQDAPERDELLRKAEAERVETEMQLGKVKAELEKLQKDISVEK